MKRGYNMIVYNETNLYKANIYNNITMMEECKYCIECNNTPQIPDEEITKRRRNVFCEMNNYFEFDEADGVAPTYRIAHPIDDKPSPTRNIVIELVNEIVEEAIFNATRRMLIRPRPRQ